MGDIMGTIRNMIWSLTHRLGFNDIIADAFRQVLPLIEADVRKAKRASRNKTLAR